MQTENAAGSPPPVDEIQKGWEELNLRVAQLEAEESALRQENKALRGLLERTIEHRQKSHSELLLLLTGLVSKLPINDVGVLVSKLVEHNESVNQYLAALVKGTVDAPLPKPVLLKALEQTKRELAAAMKPMLEELIRLETPLETELLQALSTQPDSFFSPRMARANRCFIKGHVARERVLREFGESALPLFHDMTTDPKLNPHPKADEIALGFKPDLEILVQQAPGLSPEKKQALLALYLRVQRSKAAGDQARSQRIAFQRLSFLIELLHFYEHQNTEAPDVIFAQRLPALVEQLVVTAPNDDLEVSLIRLAEELLAFVVNPDHRKMIINNVGKGGGIAKTLKFVLTLRTDKLPDPDQLIPEFLRHLLPSSHQPPAVEALTAILRLVSPEAQLMVLQGIMSSDRLRKQDAENLVKAVAANLELKGIEERLKAKEVFPPEVERQVAWAKIKDLISQRTDPTALAATIRERLHAKYDADEVRQSWLTLIEADALSLIRIFCQLPYRADGKTDSIARPIMETYVSRLMHEKYAAIYKKVATSLRNMYHAKPDSPTLLNFTALVRWVDPEAANRLHADIGMPVPQH